jgi:hypothetical protein
VIVPYDHEALWSKAKVFLNRAMDPDDVRSFDEQALWASAALELLGKAALASVSPLLIAEPTEDGTNILIAAGLIEGAAKFSSVRAATIFKRCAKAFRPFDATQAQKFANARNEYLHGSGVGFTGLDPQAWWPRFWALAATLVSAQDRELNDLVGGDRVHQVEAFLAQNAKNVEHRTEALIDRAKQRLALYRAGRLSVKAQMEWDAQSDLTVGLTYATAEACPACEELGTLEGDIVVNTAFNSDSPGDPDTGEYDGDEYWVELSISGDYFSCPTCHLVLARYELIKQAGMPESFNVIDDEPGEEPDYGND